MYSQTHRISSKRMVVTEKRKEKIGKGKRSKKKKKEKLLFFSFPHCLPGGTPRSDQYFLPHVCQTPSPASCCHHSSRETEKGAKKSRLTSASKPLFSQVGGCPWSPGCLSLCPDTPLGPPFTFAQLPAVKMTHRSKDTSSGILNHG